MTHSVQWEQGPVSFAARYTGEWLWNGSDAYNVPKSMLGMTLDSSTVRAWNYTFDEIADYMAWQVAPSAGRVHLK